jgi:hypothetical protein
MPRRAKHKTRYVVKYYLASGIESDTREISRINIQSLKDDIPYQAVSFRTHMVFRASIRHQSTIIICESFPQERSKLYYCGGKIYTRNEMSQLPQSIRFAVSNEEVFTSQFFERYPDTQILKTRTGEYVRFNPEYESVI